MYGLSVLAFSEALTRTLGWVLDCRPVPSAPTVMASLSRWSSIVVALTLNLSSTLSASALRIGSDFGSHSGLRTRVAPLLSSYAENLYGPEETIFWT